MTDVYIAGCDMQPVVKSSALGLKHLAAKSLLSALEKSKIQEPDCLLISNMLSDELDGQKHLGPLVATQAGLKNIEAWQVRAATAGGSAAIRAAWLALKSKEVQSVAITGVEIMRGSQATPILARALDLESEIKKGHTMISINAELMKSYMNQYDVSYDKFSNFAQNAHQNALHCDHAYLKKSLSRDEIIYSRIVSDPIRISDCSPVCDGTATLLLTNNPDLALTEKIILSACEVATDLLPVWQRPNPLELLAAKISSRKAFHRARLEPGDIDFFELHDAFSIMACLALESCGFAKPGQGWKMAHEGEIFADKKLPISTFGGLKARGHPVGATALYQSCEIVSQLGGWAGKNQLQNHPKKAMMQSIGGAGSTLITSIFEIV